MTIRAAFSAAKGMLFLVASMSVTRTRCFRWLTVVATLLMGLALSPYAVAQSDPSVPTVCDGELLLGPPVDSALVTWEYSPPIEGGTAHLVCAGATIASLIEESPGDWGVAVRDLRTRETLIANADRHFVAGSLYKLGVAAEAYARIDAGNLAQESLVLVSEQDVDPDYGGSRYEAGAYLSVRQAVNALSAA